MYFYELTNTTNEILGYITSYELRCYRPKRKRMICCDESKAQYVQFNDQFYRVDWLQPEDPSMIGKYPSINMRLISLDEFEEKNPKTPF